MSSNSTSVAPMSAAPELAAGTTLQRGRFTIERVLGRGGFGITYAAQDGRLQRPVAVKQLCPGDADARARFLREAAVLARFSHPGIVRVYEVFEESGTAYLVMELLEGRTLYDVLVGRAAPVTEGEALGLADHCGRALLAVHRAGVLHRDLNPTNVMVTADGRVVLIDFGLAREFAADETAVMTRMVTPGYAPPEQYAGHGRFGPPTDVYGLAATLYRALTGVAPTSALDRHAGVGLDSPHRRNPAVSKAVSDAVMDGLELDPAHRPSTIEDFLSRLRIPPLATGEQQTDGTVGPVLTSRVATAAPAPLPPAPTKVPGRMKVFVPAAVAVAAVGAAAPLLALLALTLLVLPGVATAGDVIVYTRLRRYGDRLHWKHRVALPAYVPVRFVRNVCEVCRTGAPALLLGAFIVAVGLVVDGSGLGRAAEEWIIRPGGAAVAVLISVPVMRDRLRFRAPIVGERAMRLALDDRGRLTTTGISLWIVAALLALVGFGLRPDLWPLS